MGVFDGYLAVTPVNDRVVQRALADVDMDVLATALVDLPGDVRSIFFRNMSKRAATLLAEHIDGRRGILPSRIEAAREVLAQRLQAHAKAHAGEASAENEEDLPEVALGSPEAIVSTFGRLAAFVGRHGFLPLERLESSIANPLLRMGVELLVDGTDPLLIRTILEKYQETYLQQAKATLAMIVDGIDSLAAGELPHLVEQKLRAYTARDWPMG